MGNFVTLGNCYSQSQILDSSRCYNTVVPKYVSDKNFKSSNVAYVYGYEGYFLEGING